LESGWTDLSFGEDVKQGRRSIKPIFWMGFFEHESYPGVDASGYSAIRFWANGFSSNEYDPIIRLTTNEVYEEFKISTNGWQIFQMNLSEFGTPSVVENVVFQSRSADP
jgi:hypothetical protein